MLIISARPGSILFWGQARSSLKLTRGSCMASVMHADMGEIETESVRPKVMDAKGILLQNREFLDFFWDIAKPEQEIRLKAIEDLVEYLKNSNKVRVYFQLARSLVANSPSVLFQSLTSLLTS